jgi:hypothetical protein
VQFVTSFCIIDIAECKGIFQIGERRVLIANPASGEPAVEPLLFLIDKNRKNPNQLQAA